RPWFHLHARTLDHARAPGHARTLQRFHPRSAGRSGSLLESSESVRRRAEEGESKPYGLNAGIIDKTQFSLLVTVVVLSAVVPTVVAQRFFQPDAAAEHAREQAGVLVGEAGR